MKYMCVKEGKYQFKTEIMGNLVYSTVSLEEKPYHIKETKPFRCNEETYTHTLSYRGFTFYLTEHDMMYFRKPTVTHCEIREFKSADKANEFLKEIHADDVKNVIVGKKSVIIVYKVHGEV